MDLSYLLFLQHLRRATHDVFTPFLEGLSLFALSYLVLAAAFIYWCVSKRKGLYIWASFAGAIAVNSFIKLNVCAYRPWIRDPRILPAGNAITTATGYSFPSGHCIFASTLYGATAVSFWEQKTTRLISWLCIAALVLTGFSRNYLGVHTPQDVAVGLSLGLFSVWAMDRLFTHLAAHPQQENAWLLGGFVLGVLMLLWVSVKPYPLDYVDGKLLVDPQKMLYDGYREIGILIAFCPARYIEKRWVRFTQTGLTRAGVLLGLGGVISLGCLLRVAAPRLINLCGPCAGRLLFSTFLVFYVLVFYPLFIIKVRKYLNI